MSLENVLELGKKKFEEILAGKQKAKEEKVEPEQKKEEPLEPKQKTEEELKAEEEVEDNEEALLEKPEDQLEEDEKNRLEEIKKKRIGEPSDKQLARKLRKAEKKISKLYGKTQDLEREKQREIENLTLEIAELREQIKIAKQPVEEQTAIKAEQDRVLREIEEDKDKPLSERREMSKEDWESWNDEDPLEAQRWAARNENRRIKLQKEAEEKALLAEKADEFLKKQSESYSRLIKKYPNILPKEKVLELKAKGLNKDEIQTILTNEYPEYALSDQILKENPDILKDINFGDVLAEELEKRLANVKQKQPAPKLYTEEEVAKIKEDAVKAEAERRANVDESNGSTTNGHIITSVPKNKSEKVQQLEALYAKAGLDPTKAKARMEERKKSGFVGYNPNEPEED